MIKAKYLGVVIIIIENATKMYSWKQLTAYQLHQEIQMIKINKTIIASPHQKTKTKNEKQKKPNSNNS